MYFVHRRRIKIEDKTKVIGAIWGTELIQFLAALAIFHQDDLKKRTNRITATWQSGCSGKMDDHPVHTKPNHHPTNNGSQKLFQIILSAK